MDRVRVVTLPIITAMRMSNMCLINQPLELLYLHTLRIESSEGVFYHIFSFASGTSRMHVGHGKQSLETPSSILTLSGLSGGIILTAEESEIGSRGEKVRGVSGRVWSSDIDGFSTFPHSRLLREPEANETNCQYHL